jgi:hypothetical protein
MRKRFLVPVLVGMFALGASQVFAQSATVVMRNGDRMQAEVLDMGANFTFRVNGTERQVPINDVVLIDFSGNGRNISQDELNRANDASANGYVVMRNGDTFTGRLLDVHGVPSKGFFSGDRDINLSDISRIYLGSVRNVPDLWNSAQTIDNGPSNPPRRERPWMRERANARNERTAAPAGARSVVVPANVAWTNTGFNVARGQWLRFEPSGEIRLSFNGDDMATAAGAKSFRFAQKAPIPTIPAGALIGRVGNGQPFSIGDTTQAFQMPADGRLFLGINDDHLPDNSGNIVVKVWEP